MRIRRLCVVALVCATGSVRAAFAPDERDRVVAYWTSSGRYAVTAPQSVEKTGPWQVRLTAEGSTWLWNYYHACGYGKVPPGAVPEPRNERQRAWEAWIEARIAYDRWQATEAAGSANEKAVGRRLVEALPQPAEPGPMPSDLLSLVGEAPPFAAAVSPQRYVVKFDDGVTISYTDQVPMRPRYAYFRSPQGVMYGGTPVKKLGDEEIGALFTDAGIDASAARVMRSVSMLEGGFESVNTYDTGFVSVGFIQFACLAAGAGSLGQVLIDMKRVSPAEFDRDFRRYGIDVDENGVLDVIDPTTGLEARGPDGAKKIIDDKRLIAVFQHAGTTCRAFRIAQLRVAKSQYYPTEDPIIVIGADGPIAGKIGDFIKSEAGMATLMDRKVNTGKTDPLAAIAGRIAKDCGAKSLADLLPYEREIVNALRYRKDYLTDATLSQPPASLPGARSYNAYSRSGMRRPHRANRRG